jgi:hypothetical protein
MSQNPEPDRDEMDEVDAETVANRDPEAFVTENPLVELLTPAAKVKILLALMRLRGGKLNPTGIAERAAITQHTWYEHRDELVDVYGVIEEAGNAGNSPLYRVDMDHPIIQRLDEILDLAAERRNRVTDPDR